MTPMETMPNKASGDKFGSCTANIPLSMGYLAARTFVLSPFGECSEKFPINGQGFLNLINREKNNA